MSRIKDSSPLFSAGMLLTFYPWTGELVKFKMCPKSEALHSLKVWNISVPQLCRWPQFLLWPHLCLWSHLLHLWPQLWLSVGIVHRGSNFERTVTWNYQKINIAAILNSGFLKYVWQQPFARGSACVISHMIVMCCAAQSFWMMCLNWETVPKCAVGSERL